MSYLSRAIGKASFSSLRVQRANANFLAKAVAKPFAVQVGSKGEHLPPFLFFLCAFLTHPKPNIQLETWISSKHYFFSMHNSSQLCYRVQVYRWDSVCFHSFYSIAILCVKCNGSLILSLFLFNQFRHWCRCRRSVRTGHSSCYLERSWSSRQRWWSSCPWSCSASWWEHCPYYCYGRYRG